MEMEDTAQSDHTTHQQQKNHSEVSVTLYGLFTSSDNPGWAATPDGLVQDLNK